MEQANLEELYQILHTLQSPFLDDPPKESYVHSIVKDLPAEDDRTLCASLQEATPLAYSSIILLVVSPKHRLQLLEFLLTRFEPDMFSSKDVNVFKTLPENIELALR